MRIGQMNPPTDVKLWEKISKARTLLLNRMSDSDRAAWEKLVDPRLAKFRAANPQGDDRTRWFYQLYMKDYLRCVESVDDSVGQLLKYLDDSGLAKNTIVVYTSDQGFYLGEHGWFDKRFMYEESLRTPLVIRWPGVVQAGQRGGADRLERRFRADVFGGGGRCSSEGYAGSQHARRFCTASRRRIGGSRFTTTFTKTKTADHHVAKHEGVTNGRAKLIHFYTLNEWELYDLEKDPHELVNVYGQPEYAQVQADLSAELERLRTELQVPANER